MTAIRTFKTNVLSVLSCMSITENEGILTQDTSEGLVEELCEIPSEIPERSMEMPEPPVYRMTGCLISVYLSEKSKNKYLLTWVLTIAYM